MSLVPRPDPESFLPMKPVDLLVLMVLLDSDLHGYGIVREIGERTGGQVKLVPGNFYSILKRLMDSGVLDEAFSRLPSVETPFIPDFATPNYQSYVVRLIGAGREERDRVINTLGETGVAARPGVMACHREASYQGARRVGNLPHTEAATDQTLVLPIFPELADDELRYVIDRFRDAVAECC